ncbi:Hypothetical protein SMAX5B_010048 [Scophthalmus maximus]|uniref:Uncharacterized protein n=1 Tax=Scophthalmus maximus TaxID=52904 RepID=A0A2U9BWF0_SCOMX|nr:Hypothetical protein SMAX5B_010048 [Scophthalmus maximus]
MGPLPLLGNFVDTCGWGGHRGPPAGDALPIAGTTIGIARLEPSGRRSAVTRRPR